MGLLMWPHSLNQKAENMADNEDYFTAGPVNQTGIYETRRSVFDGIIGSVDGVASLITGFGHVVGSATDIRDDVAQSNAVWNDVQLDKEEREQGILLNFLKTERGDNVQLYYAAAAVALGFIILTR